MNDSPLNNEYLREWERLNIPPFQSLYLEIEGKTRHFSAWLWEGRVHFRDEVRPWMRWATMETWNEELPVEQFWRQALQTRRVGRDLEFRRGLGSSPFIRSAPYYSTLSPWKMAWNVVVSDYGQAWARHKQGKKWYPLEVREEYPITSQGAHVPSIFSHQRHFKSVRSALRNVSLEMAVEGLSPLQRLIWLEGATSQPMRLVRNALLLGLLDGYIAASQYSYAQLKVPEFWDVLFEGVRLSQVETLAAVTNIEGQLWVSNGRGHYSLNTNDGSSAVNFLLTVNSAHERLEAYMELRDWLLGAFAPHEVERLLARVKNRVT